MTEHFSAPSYERSKARKGYRNGYCPRQLYTRIGKLVLRVPQSRDGKFSYPESGAEDADCTLTQHDGYRRYKSIKALATLIALCF